METLTEIMFKQFPSEEGKFQLDCKLTGNGAEERPAKWIGNKRSIEHCVNDMLEAGYTISDCVVTRFKR